MFERNLCNYNRHNTIKLFSHELNSLAAQKIHNTVAVVVVASIEEIFDNQIDHNVLHHVERVISIAAFSTAAAAVVVIVATIAERRRGGHCRLKRVEVILHELECIRVAVEILDQAFKLLVRRTQ